MTADYRGGPTVKRLTRTTGRFAVCGDIGNTGVVKSTGTPLHGAVHVPAQSGGPVDGGTREAVARLLMEQGPITAAQVAAALELSSPAVRRHLDALLADGEAESREATRRGPRGRGRPARQYLLTDSGRARFGHGYDDLAVAALRYLARHGGPDAVQGFAQSRVEELLGDGLAQIEAAQGADARTHALATVLTARGYAAQAREGGGHGVQLCQHHCPVAHVAAEFPALCEAETHAFAELIGTHVQRLATIARGDSACTTHIPLDAPEFHRKATTTIPRGRQSE
jgi:predicted ArsR family transcriptional regulator